MGDQGGGLCACTPLPLTLAGNDMPNQKPWKWQFVWMHHATNRPSNKTSYKKRKQNTWLDQKRPTTKRNTWLAKMPTAKNTKWPNSQPSSWRSRRPWVGCCSSTSHTARPVALTTIPSLSKTCAVKNGTHHQNLNIKTINNQTKSSTKEYKVPWRTRARCCWGHFQTDFRLIFSLCGTNFATMSGPVPNAIVKEQKTILYVDLVGGPPQGQQPARLTPWRPLQRVHLFWGTEHYSRCLTRNLIDNWQPGYNA